MVITLAITLAIDLDARARAASDASGGHRIAQRQRQIFAQPFARHLENVVHSTFSGRRFQVLSGAAMDVEDVAAAADQRPGRGNLLQQSLLSQFAQRHFTRAGHLASHRAGGD